MAAPTVKISDIGVIKPLTQVLLKDTNPQQGFLQGIRNSAGELVIYGCARHEAKKDWKSDASQLHQTITTGINICGIWYTHQAPASVDSIKQCCQPILSDIPEITSRSSQVVVCHIKEGTKSPEDDCWYMYDTQTHTAEPCPMALDITAGRELQEEYVTLRIQTNITLEFSYANDNDLQRAVAHHFNIINNKVQSPATIYKIQKTKILIGQQGDDVICMGPLNKDNAVSDIFKYMEEEEDNAGWGGGGGGKKTGKKAKKAKEVLEVGVLARLSEGLGTIEEDKQIGCVPVIHYETFEDDWQHASLYLPLSVPVIVPSTSHLSELHMLCTEGIQRQLRAMETCLINHSIKSGSVCVPKPHHFQPGYLHHFLTLLYPVGIPDQQLEDFRRQVHEQFLLPLDRPLFRRTNAYMFPSDRKGDVYLTNTHVGLAPSGVEGGTPSIVQGTYAYHHYMQDHFDDNKWGCAYRSLQTLFSWFRHQGYMDHSIPTHREIQQALVDVQDKPANFVGSRQWIGSIEVSTVLNQLLGVTSKIMFVSSGAEMASKGRELAVHFQTQGTPVMIGGGVLAHTILGVDWSDKSGDIKFLILDPHYTGGEDLKVIQDKGWCGWKGLDFWDQTAYYNLCLPQRPIEI
ncbi:ufm1-specific protease 2-like [Amphiura filiformis]|uniref:ufm1-specific protease 2-like n=1 Tax=Amphiura filiformis TaxID=82378 RepID=UPI003B216505